MLKNFDSWNELKKKIEARPLVFCNQREIWWCSIGVNIGAEASGKNELFERPVLIVGVYSTQSILVVPITSKPRETSDQYHFRITYKGLEGWLVLSHARTISPKRLQRKLHRIDAEQHKKALAALLSLVNRRATGATTKSAPVSRSLGARRPDKSNTI